MLNYRKINETILDHPVSGPGIRSTKFGNLIPGNHPAILVFLSQLGSPFAKECVTDLRTQQSRDTSPVPVIFVIQEDHETGQRFFDRYWPNAQSITDTDGFWYQEFGIPAAGITDFIRPGALLAAARALLKGHRVTTPTASVWQMPGMIILDRQRVLWSHYYRHLGDRPGMRRLGHFAQSLGGQKPTNTARKSRPRNSKVEKTDLKAVG